MNCPQCGIQIHLNTQACPHCGMQITSYQTPSSPDQMVQVPLSASTSQANACYGNQQQQNSFQSGYAEPTPQPVPQVPEPYVASGFVPEPAPYTTEQKPSKRSKKPWIIAGSALLVVALSVGVFFGVNAFFEGQKSEAYAAAVEQMNDGDYQGALAGFTDLGEYEDSQDMAHYCMQVLSFQEAEQLLGDKDYAAARDAFATLGSFMDADEQVVICDAWLAFSEACVLTDEGKYEEAAEKAAGFTNVFVVSNSPEAMEWLDRNRYGLADLRFAGGQYYQAYTQFIALGDYEDAASRAEGCKQSMPGSGELYHNDGYYSSSTELVFDAGTTSEAHYIKVYNGETLVSILFVHPGTTSATSLPSGSYTFKSGSGNAWFGESDMFGADGYYSVMLFDGGSETVWLDANMIYTVTLQVADGGNVGNRSEDPSNI